MRQLTYNMTVAGVNAVLERRFSEALIFLPALFILSALLFTSCSGNGLESVYIGEYVSTSEWEDDNLRSVITIKLESDGSFSRDVLHTTLDSGDVIHEEVWAGNWRVLDDREGVILEEKEGVFSFIYKKTDDGNLAFVTDHDIEVYVKK